MIQQAEIASILQKLKTTPSERLESDILEFKLYSSEQALHNAKELAEEFSALANHRGGHIIVGIRDSSDIRCSRWIDQLVGFPIVDLHTTQERLSGKLRPKQNLSLAQYTFEGCNYLIICVPKHRDTLVSTTSGKVCIRDGKSSRAMEPDEISKAVKALQDYDWSAEYLDITADNALDTEAVTEAFLDFSSRRQTTNSTIPDFLEAIGVTVNGRLTKSGLLLLGKATTIREKLGNFEYRFSRKTRTGQLLINDVWDDCLWHTIKRAKTHFENCNTPAEIVFQKAKYSVQLLDRIAFHEAFLNALVHRDYSLDGMVAVEFLDDKLTITSPGIFYGGVRPENIFRHEPRHRNKNLARMLMEYHLVDRAGMGVFRMSLNSLRYGRGFPTFEEQDNSVIVTMQAQYIRPAVFVTSETHKDVCGISEFMVLNSVYQTGLVPVSSLEAHLCKIEADPWEKIKVAVNNLPYVQFCGDKSGVYIRTRPDWNNFFEVQKTYRLSPASGKYVDLYMFLKIHRSAPNSDIKALLGHNHTSQTSMFLRDTKFVRRQGKGPGATWSLTEAETCEQSAQPDAQSAGVTS
ncbi:ATP-binding protein [Desulfonatronum lacustre]|uniref:ATP-binding protein n=1 Tax=Desulfonatronum lacustre TaxID=66849 RepID=UPI00048BB512|nr:ATP-binding protein [Desulfonatronum lacustre]